MKIQPKDNLILGDWKACCDSCGFVFHASELRRRWDGFMVCEKDWEERHPQDLIRLRPEKSNVSWARPEPEPTYRVVAPADPTAL